jgi:hypothetical protein
VTETPLGLLNVESNLGFTQSQKPTEIGTETVETETASGIMAIFQTKGCGIHSLSLVNKQTEEAKP